MDNHDVVFWGGTLFWALSGFALGWVLGRHEMMLRAMREKRNHD